MIPIEKAIQDNIMKILFPENTKEIIETVFSESKVESIAKEMAKAVFAADIIISKYMLTETKDKDGKIVPVEAYVIDNTMMPQWETSCAMAKAKGVPRPYEKTIIFPNVDKCLEAIDIACSQPKAENDGGLMMEQTHNLRTDIENIPEYTLVKVFPRENNPIHKEPAVLTYINGYFVNSYNEPDYYFRDFLKYNKGFQI